MRLFLLPLALFLMAASAHAQSGASPPRTPAASPSAAVTNDGRRDFDFINGRWKVANRIRSKPGTDEWVAFDLDYEGWTVMDSLANFDRMRGNRGGRYFEGVSVRTFDPATREWIIYWMDIRSPQLTEQTRGRFEGDVGTFESTDHETRFIWRRIGSDRAHWEQRVRLPNGAWEANWTMDFSRIDQGGKDRPAFSHD